MRLCSLFLQPSPTCLCCVCVFVCVAGSIMKTKCFAHTLQNYVMPDSTLNWEALTVREVFDLLGFPS